MPEAAPTVDQWRVPYTRHGGLGVPAHVAVLYPFAPRASLDETLLGQVCQLAERHAAFDVVFRRVERWPDGIVYLPPEPPAPFVSLTEDACARWPAYPPYGGAHEEHLPHLTVSHDEAVADRAARAVAGALPIAARAHELTLLVEGEDGRWQAEARFRLGARRHE